jgi:uncharacterized coiled-coil protein SlyX
MTTDQKLESMRLEYLERQRGHRAALEARVEILIDAYKGQSHMVSLLSAQVVAQQEQIEKMRAWAAKVHPMLKTLEKGNAE